MKAKHLLPAMALMGASMGMERSGEFARLAKEPQSKKTKKNRVKNKAARKARRKNKKR